MVSFPWCDVVVLALEEALDLVEPARHVHAGTDIASPVPAGIGFDALVLSDVVATPDGVSILGATATKNRLDATIWHSSVGTSWRPIRIAKGDMFPREMAVTPGGVWVATAIDGDAQNYALWRSSDGEIWEAVPDHPMIDPDPDRKVTLSEIIATDAGVFAAVNWSDASEDQLGSIWHSETGADWTLAAESDSTAGAAGVVSGSPVVIMQSLLPDGADSAQTATVFHSADGLVGPRHQ